MTCRHGRFDRWRSAGAVVTLCLLCGRRWIVDARGVRTIGGNR